MVMVREEDESWREGAPRAMEATAAISAMAAITAMAAMAQSRRLLWPCTDSAKPAIVVEGELGRGRARDGGDDGNGGEGGEGGEGREAEEERQPGVKGILARECRGCGRCFVAENAFDGMVPGSSTSRDRISHDSSHGFHPLAVFT